MSSSDAEPREGKQAAAAASAEAEAAAAAAAAAPSAEPASRRAQAAPLPGFDWLVLGATTAFALAAVTGILAAHRAALPLGVRLNLVASAVETVGEPIRPIGPTLGIVALGLLALTGLCLATFVAKDRVGGPLLLGFGAAGIALVVWGLFSGPDLSLLFVLSAPGQGLGGFGLTTWLHLASLEPMLSVLAVAALAAPWFTQRQGKL